MNAISRSFRIGWVALTAVAWIFIVYLASHKSKNTDILSRYSWDYFALLCTALSFTTLISIANRRVILGRIYAWRQIPILFLASLFVTFCLVETFLRTVDPLGLSYYQEVARYHLDKMADPELIYRHRPSWDAVYQGVTVHFNEFGLRDDPIHSKRHGEYRILALGDTDTFGWGVDKEKIFPTRLQQLLTKKLGRPVRVINAGVGGYNSVQQYNFLNSKGLSFEPDLVLLAYVSHNDLDIHKTPFDPWTARSFIGKSPREAVNLLMEQSWIYRLTDHALKNRWFGNTRSYSSDSLEGSLEWTASMEALKSIVSTCKNHKIPLAIFYFAWQPTPEEIARLTDVRESVAPVLVEETSRWFVGKEVRQYFNSQIDTHPNAEGHEIVAEHIANYLLSRYLSQ